MSLSGVIMAETRLSSTFKFEEFTIYFKNLTFFLFFILLADELRYFFGILSFKTTLVKHGTSFFQPILLK